MFLNQNFIDFSKILQIYAHIFVSFAKLKPQTYKLFRSQSFQENRKRDIFQILYSLHKVYIYLKKNCRVTFKLTIVNRRLIEPS